MSFGYSQMHLLLYYVNVRNRLPCDFIVVAVLTNLDTSMSTLDSSMQMVCSSNFSLFAGQVQINSGLRTAEGRTVCRAYREDGNPPPRTMDHGSAVRMHRTGMGTFRCSSAGLSVYRWTSERHKLSNAVFQEFVHVIQVHIMLCHCQGIAYGDTEKRVALPQGLCAGALLRSM